MIEGQALHAIGNLMTKSCYCRKSFDIIKQLSDCCYSYTFTIVINKSTTSVSLIWSIQVILGNLQKYVSTSGSLLQCKTLPAHFSNNMMVYCLLNVI